MKKMILHGAGGHAFAVVELIRSLGQYTIDTVYDAQPKITNVLGVPVKKSSDLTESTMPMGISIGDNAVRRKIAEQFSVATFPSFIHNSVMCYPSVSIGKGTMVLPGAILDASVSIGDFCIINNNATISHNATLGNFTHIAISTAICGGVSVGEGTLIGAGSIILPGVDVGKWSVVGAGAVVTRNVPDYTVVYGNPAKTIKTTFS